jgi:signal transduction histidine kinase
LFFGKAGGLHFFFLLFSSFPVLVWTTKNYLFVYLFYIINFISFIYIEFFPIHSPYLIQSEYSGIIATLSILSCSLGVLAVVNFNQEQAEKNEISLEKQAKDLSLTNTRLNESNTTKDTLMSIIAHDLRNPFSKIIGFSDIIVQNIEEYDKEKIHTLASAIRDSSISTNVLLENLLEWAMSQRGTIQMNPVKTNLFMIIESAYSTQINIARSKNILLSNTVSPVIDVLADKHMLQTVLRNLVSNAIKFSQEGSDVIISAKKTGEWIEISVTDQGVGITNGNCTKLFTLNREKSTVGTSGEPGTGLGLILCKDFIEKHGGTINVESIPGKGCRFFFNLPTA